MAELGPEARALLRAGRTVLRPTLDDRSRVFAALRSRLETDTGSSPPIPGAPKAAVGSPVLSAVAVGLAVAGVITSVALFRNTSPSPGVVPPRATASVAASVAPSVPIATPTPAAERISAAAPPSDSSNARTTSSRRTDLLGAEVAILSRAATELHAGHFASALKLLDEHARTFPRGTLTQERIAARVQALCGLGRVAEAKAELLRLGRGSLQEGSAREACDVK
jgi:hypothetical protein